MKRADQGKTGNRAKLQAAGARFTRISILGFLLAAGCDRMVTPRQTQAVKDADARCAQGDYAGAVSLYESALDGTARSAEIHYKLALLYDDKLNEPLNALHHFKRYLALQPSGARATEVKDFIKRDEITLLTSLSGDSIVTRTEAARLMNENLSLRRQLEEKTGKARPTDDQAAPKAERAEKSAGKSRTYVVQSGDTLYSISRKFYKTPSHWKQIRDANREKLVDPARLQPGETLTIP